VTITIKKEEEKPTPKAHAGLPVLQGYEESE
jgi:hypothetical protein